MPHPNFLPEGIKSLVDWQTAHIRHDPDFRRDIKKLVGGIEAILKIANTTPDTILLKESLSESILLPRSPISQTVTSSRKSIAKQTKPRKTTDKSLKTIYLGKGTKLELLYIPSFKFLMGPPEGEGNDFECLQHEVILPEFWMSKYPVTQAQYQVVTGENPSRFKGFLGLFQNRNRPVERVSWHDANGFCQKVFQKSGEFIRLPSEAEWEYACRARTTTPYSFGETITKQQACYDRTTKEGTTPVGSYSANTFGLYDMHGNVWEWCQDQYHDSYNGAPTDGTAWEDREKNASCILRGGSWNNSPRSCRSAVRDIVTPGYRGYAVGFRVVCSAPRILQ
ncbi:MAG: formylglycine-generating enzyme family protein [Leptolyngbya sp. SIO3F4]|nr:formylglycine-generating enzyme family protein [Leptolyngbya sp. SIO3F4]